MIIVRNRRSATALLTAAVLGALVVPAAAAAAPLGTATQDRQQSGAAGQSVTRASAGQLPVRAYTGNATQVLTVTAHPNSVHAVIQRWARSGSGWVPQGPKAHAYIGEAGMTSSPRESYPGTPKGSYPLTTSFGRLPNPGIRLPYLQTGWSDWWAGDRNSPATYNSHQRCSSCAFNTSVSENLYGAGAVYDWAVVIDYNIPQRTPGAGSGFFLHLDNRQATAGCVAVTPTQLRAFMRWLNPAAHPRIVMGAVPASTPL